VRMSLKVICNVTKVLLFMPATSISVFQNSHYVIIAMLLAFAIVHSGLAALRPWGESKIGARFYRVIFALVSIPAATALIIYFFNHRYDGLELWDLRETTGIKETVWILSAISFLFLYPATFNLLEVAAIQKPQFRLYETGIIRVTRHPQMVGQLIWCVAHSLWIGSSFMIVTSIGLMAHHLFAVWHGDQRLFKRYGDDFVAAQERTSIWPFVAILQGKQQLNWQEFLRPAYVGVAIFVGVFWWGHPYLVGWTAMVPW
jgi:uncharacterized membrane protein